MQVVSLPTNFEKGKKTQQLVDSINKFPNKIKQISCGFNHIVILDDKNCIYSFGNNEYGQLGLDQFENTTSLQKVNYFYNNKKTVDYIYKENIKSVACGGNFSIVLTSENEFYETGHLSSQKALKYCFTKVFYENKIEIGEIIKMQCGDGFTIIMNEKNDLFGMGDKGFGDKVGLKDFDDRVKPFTKLPFYDHINVKIKDFTCGSRHITVLTQTNDIYLVGSFHVHKIQENLVQQIASTINEEFVLTNNNVLKSCLYSPTEYNSLNFKVKKIFSNFGHDLYLLSENRVYKLNDDDTEQFNEIEKEWNLPHVYVFDNLAVSFLVSSNEVIRMSGEVDDNSEKGRFFRMKLMQQLLRNDNNLFKDITIYFNN